MTGEGGGEQGERGEVAPAVPAKRGSTASSVMSGGEESVEVPPPPPPKTANRASGGTLGDGVSLVQLIGGTPWNSGVPYLENFYRSSILSVSLLSLSITEKDRNSAYRELCSIAILPWQHHALQ